MSQTCPKGTICIDTTMMILILIGIGIVGYLGYMHYFANKQFKIIKSLKKKKILLTKKKKKKKILIIKLIIIQLLKTHLKTIIYQINLHKL